MDNETTCVEVRADANTISKWRWRFAECRRDRLLDEPRPGASRAIGDDEIAEKIRPTLEAMLPNATRQPNIRDRNYKKSEHQDR